MSLADEISAFHHLLPRMRAQRAAWVVIAGQEWRGSFRTFEAAAIFAIEEFGERIFLLRHTDKQPAELPFANAP